MKPRRERPRAIAAIKSSDENLAAVLLALDEPQSARNNRRVCRIGSWFSTIRRSIDVRKILNEAGLRGDDRNQR